MFPKVSINESARIFPPNKKFSTNILRDVMTANGLTDKQWQELKLRLWDTTGKKTELYELEQKLDAICSKTLKGKIIAGVENALVEKTKNKKETELVEESGGMKYLDKDGIEVSVGDKVSIYGKNSLGGYTVIGKLENGKIRYQIGEKIDTIMPSEVWVTKKFVGEDSSISKGKIYEIDGEKYKLDSFGGEHNGIENVTLINVDSGKKYYVNKECLYQGSFRNFTKTLVESSDFGINDILDLGINLDDNQKDAIKSYLKFFDTKDEFLDCINSSKFKDALRNFKTDDKSIFLFFTKYFQENPGESLAESTSNDNVTEIRYYSRWKTTKDISFAINSHSRNIIGNNIEIPKGTEIKWDEDSRDGASFYYVMLNGVKERIKIWCSITSLVADGRIELIDNGNGIVAYKGEYLQKLLGINKANESEQPNKFLSQYKNQTVENLNKEKEKIGKELDAFTKKTNPTQQDIDKNAENTERLGAINELMGAGTENVDESTTIIYNLKDLLNSLDGDDKEDLYSIIGNNWVEFYDKDWSDEEIVSELSFYPEMEEEIIDEYVASKDGEKIVEDAEPEKIDGYLAIESDCFKLSKQSTVNWLKKMASPALYDMISGYLFDKWRKTSQENKGSWEWLEMVISHDEMINKAHTKDLDETKSSDLKIGDKVTFTHRNSKKTFTGKYIEDYKNGWIIVDCGKDGKVATLPGDCTVVKDGDNKVLESGKQMTLSELEDHINSNISDIEKNMAYYGYDSAKQLAAIDNYYDLANVLGVDSRLLKTVEIEQYARTTSDLVGQGGDGDMDESNDFYANSGVNSKALGITDDIGTFWVITKPKGKSTLNDIFFEADIMYMMNQFRGGLKDSEIVGFYSDETRGKVIAENLVANQLVESKNGKAFWDDLPKSSQNYLVENTKRIGDSYIVDDADGRPINATAISESRDGFNFKLEKIK